MPASVFVARKGRGISELTQSFMRHRHAWNQTELSIKAATQEWFSDAHQAHAFTVTSVGHAAILSGAYPYQTGIIGNDWKSRDGKFVYNTADAAHK